MNKTLPAWTYIKSFLPKVIRPNGIHGTMVHWPSPHAAKVNLQAWKSPWSSRGVEL